MNITKLLVLLFSVSLLLFIGIYFYFNNTNRYENKDYNLQNETQTQTDNVNDNTEDDLNMGKGVYEIYDEAKILRAENGNVVLFFHASWCPTCRSLNNNIESNVSEIPNGVSILKVDYDTETILKKKYGVTYQHTLVQVDKNGELIKKWSGSQSLERLLNEIN